MMVNLYLSPRSVIDWLRLIPFERARQEAIENWGNPKLRHNGIVTNKIYPALSQALEDAFYWPGAPQGNEYWTQLWLCITSMERSVRAKETINSYYERVFKEIELERGQEDCLTCFGSGQIVSGGSFGGAVRITRCYCLTGQFI